MFPYTRPALKPIYSALLSSLNKLGTPTNALAPFLTRHHVFAMVIKSPQGLIASPYLKGYRTIYYIIQVVLYIAE